MRPFVVSGKPGREHLVAIISKQPLVKDWLPVAARLPAKTLTEADVEQLLQTIKELPVTDWIALSTYFDVVAIVAEWRLTNARGGEQQARTRQPGELEYDQSVPRKP